MGKEEYRQPEFKIDDEKLRVVEEKEEELEEDGITILKIPPEDSRFDPRYDRYRGTHWRR